mgnify:CR=1 FL=1
MEDTPDKPFTSQQLQQDEILMVIERLQNQRGRLLIGITALRQGTGRLVMTFVNRVGVEDPTGAMFHVGRTVADAVEEGFHSDILVGRMVVFVVRAVGGPDGRLLQHVREQVVGAGAPAGGPDHRFDSVGVADGIDHHPRDR